MKQLVTVLLLCFISSAAFAKTVHVSPSGDTSGLTDHSNITTALGNAGPGDTVKLAAGTYFVDRSIVQLDFDGRIKGAGRDATVVRTAPGKSFDVSEGVDVFENLYFPGAGSLTAAMWVFAYHPADDAKTFRLSDLSIVIDEPAADPPLAGFFDLSGNLLNAMVGVVVTNTESLWAFIGVPSDAVNLDVGIESMSITGEVDPQYRGFFDSGPLDRNTSIIDAIDVFGPWSGKGTTVKDVHVKNADFGMNLSLSPDTQAVVRDSSMEHVVNGLESFFADGDLITNNDIRDFNGFGVILHVSPGSQVKGNTISGDALAAIHFDFSADVVAKNNEIVGSYGHGIWPLGAPGCSVFGNSLGEVEGMAQGILTNEGAVAVEASSGCEVKGNSFTSVGGASAVRIFADSDGNTIRNNDFEDSGIGSCAILLEGDGNLVRVEEDDFPDGTYVASQICDNGSGNTVIVTD